jgi:glycosyltransferase involved in cell wall biosynthesis
MTVSPWDHNRVLNIRWVTWSPLPYWIDRLNALADYPGVELEVVVMRASETSYAFTIDPSTWRFRSRVLSSRPGEVGFARASVLPRTLQSLTNGPNTTRLVMPYADGTFILAAISSRIRGMSYSLFVASTADDARSGAPIYEITKRWMFKNAERCLATGPLQAAYVRSYDPDARISIIGNPVDVSRFTTTDPDVTGRRERLRAARGWSDRFVVGYVGRLSPEKDLPTLVRAAAVLAKENQPVTVAVAGYGRMEGSLRRLSSELQTDVRFLGFLDGIELGDLYRSLDAFCLPSASEAWGLVVNEAMAMGLPVVVSDRVGSRTLLEDGKSGLIFPVGDAAALAERLAGLARSVELRRRLGAAAFKSIQAHTISAWTRAVVDALGDGHARS